MKNHPTAIILSLSLLIGIITLTDYGESWDELKFYKYADRALSAYTTWPSEGTVARFGNTYDNYGPAFVMLVTLTAKPLQIIFTESDARHYLYFITFLAGVWAFYELANRWLTKNAALFSTLLFATQPLLIGHAFISPKDIPFLSLFLLSVHFGLSLFDSPKPIQLHNLTPSSKRTLALLTTLWLVSVFSLFIFTQAFHNYITSLVISAQSGGTNIITLIAKNITAVSSAVYVQRYFLLFLKARTYYFLLITALLFFIWYRLQPNLLKLLITVLPSAILLGLTTSTRVLGPLAGLIVVYFALRAKGRQAIPALTIYAVIAIMTMYLTWPYLWMDPVGHFFESLKVMSLYPWEGLVLFNGVSYQSTDLPYSYLPVLFAIQLTEPVWALSIIGWVAAIIGGVRHLRRTPHRPDAFSGVQVSGKRGLVELAFLWFVIPFIGFVVLRTPLYDNFRQVLFILPPIFLMAGVAIEKIKNTKWQVALVTLCLIPGVIGIVSLHPYEYIYYNRFVGGLDGAQGRFALDYWVISYREAADYVNSVASPNAAIWVEGPSHLFALFAREDLKIYSWNEVERADHYEYVVATTRYDFDKTSYPEAEIVHKIMRGNALLAVIKKP
ncbi:MAG: hypothetical protein Q7J80_11915 [Anaerolineales bacterium]|nr:hypothetical protein [Anaerolineales bacterium]